MKYTAKVLIDQPREKVVELMDNPDNMKYWQKGLVSFEHLSGESGKQGAKMKMKYKMGKRDIEMVETIIESNFPDEFHCTYETSGVFNIQKNYFSEEGDKTRWISESEFQFSGFMKIMGLFMGSKPFKKQSMIYLEDFKAFAEGNPRHGN